MGLREPTDRPGELRSRDLDYETGSGSRGRDAARSLRANPRRSRARLVALLLAGILAAGAAEARTLVADPGAVAGQPGYYRDLVVQLQPGDTLELPAGTYRDRLALSGLQGRADAWITISGPSSGAPAVITTASTCCNNVQLGNTWYVAIKNLTVDSNSDGVQAAIDGINAKDGMTHDILIENCILKGLSYDQLTVGIATRTTAWNWTIRRNTIQEAGTGMYLGNSDGSAPFVAGVIEGNLFVDTIGYNVEIKFQNAYTPPAGMPAGAHRTIIRNNVFVKRRAQSSWPLLPDGSSRVAGARPNLLVGGFPGSGAGADDLYEIYGNFFYMNPDESLFQGSGRMTLHDNVFVGASGTAVSFQNHDLPLKLAHAYNNTVYGGDFGIRFGSAAPQGSAAVGNLVFAGNPISGTIADLRDNITGAVANAAAYVTHPSLVPGQMNFYPLPGQARGTPMSLSAFAGQTDYTLDFNGTSKADLLIRGAYAGEGTNPGWQLDVARKQGGPSSGPALPPGAPTGLRVR
jgi:hypothetical protein